MSGPAIRQILIGKSIPKSSGLTKRSPTLNYPLYLLRRKIPSAEAAALELRWLREHVAPGVPTHEALTIAQHEKLKELCTRRAAGEPLQYILGTEFFGALEVLCRKGVLIPRQDTAAATSSLAMRLLRVRENPQVLRHLDLCTGSGAIPLLMSHTLREMSGDSVIPECLGVDISKPALDLAMDNRRKLMPKPLRYTVNFVRTDMLHALNLETHQTREDTSWLRQPWDVVTANPPYISPALFLSRTVDPSVRNWEPKSALVPSWHDQEPNHEEAEEIKDAAQFGNSKWRGRIEYSLPRYEPLEHEVEAIAPFHVAPVQAVTPLEVDVDFDPEFDEAAHNKYVPPSEDEYEEDLLPETNDFDSELYRRSQGEPGKYVSPENPFRTWDPRKRVNSDRSRDKQQADLFYTPILDIAKHVSAKVVMMEIAGYHQARRIGKKVLDDTHWEGAELWREHPEGLPEEATKKWLHVERAGGRKLRCRGTGEVRTLIVWRGIDAALWMRPIEGRP